VALLWTTEFAPIQRADSTRRSSLRAGFSSTDSAMPFSLRPEFAAIYEGARRLTGTPGTSKRMHYLV
jgi:hypothetical protein